MSDDAGVTATASDDGDAPVPSFSMGGPALRGARGFETWQEMVSPVFSVEQEIGRAHV